MRLLNFPGCNSELEPFKNSHERHEEIFDSLLEYDTRKLVIGRFFFVFFFSRSYFSGLTLSRHHRESR